MKLKGITIDFDDRKTCGLLPDLCLAWDERYDELEDNSELLEYWESRIEQILAQTKNVVCGNIGAKSIIYSENEEAVEAIKNAFKELKLMEIEYEDIMKCENCLKYDYLDK